MDNIRLFLWFALLGSLWISYTTWVADRAPAESAAAVATEPRAGWRATVRTQRVRLRDVLTPTLRREVETELAALYVDARGLADGALRDHGEPAAADALPQACPYSLDQIASDWLPK